jgi:nitrite reductase/ring-hydroxylating ferredoxin subunit
LVAEAAQLESAAMIGVTAAGTPLAVCRIGGEYFAFRDRCPHQGAALSGGCIVEGFVECPQHFALFDVRTGDSDGSVTAAGVQTFPARRVDDRIEVDL